MTFTDDDLSRLKDILAKTIEPNSEDAQEFCRLAVDNCGALLARLEAAEKVCVGIENICDKHDLHGQAEIDIKAWRKACGK